MEPESNPTLSITEKLSLNPQLFQGKKILVVGDIALDRTFLCDAAPAGRHAIHAGESILDVRPSGDDFGAVGASHNICVLCKSVGVENVLVTASGTDPEGARVAEILALSGTSGRHVRLEGIQTVTRYRFFTYDPLAGRFELTLRVDKDPDATLSYAVAEEQVTTDEFLDWFEIEASSADVVLFNDTDKGFLSRNVLAALDGRIRRVSEGRQSLGLAPIIVVVDPKREWEKYRGLQVDVLKPNQVEACGVAGLQEMDFGKDANLHLLADRILGQFGNAFMRIVVTLGAYGALLIENAGGAGMLYRFPALQLREPSKGITMHCGDMFDSALALGLALGEDIYASVTFANYAASLQVSKAIGEKVSLADLTDELNVRHFLRSAEPHRLLDAWQH